MAEATVPEALEAAEVMSNWHLLSAAFSVNHACVGTILIYSTTLLGARVGYVGNALLYVFTCGSSLFASVPVIAATSPRNALALAMAMYSAYVGFFAVATVLPRSSPGQWLVFLPACCLGGLGAGVLWTAQGGCLSRSADAFVAATAEGGRQSATARHSAVFAVYYLVGEVGFKLLSSAAIGRGWQPWVIFTVCLACAVAATCMVLRLRDFGTESKAVQPKAASKLLAAAGLWSDPVIWCLSPTNLAFGFSAALMNGYMAAEFTEPQLGEKYVGYFATATAVLSAVFSQLFGMASVRMGTKGPVLFAGSLCFFGVPVLLLTFHHHGWHYWLIVPYIVQGCGRAVYESTNRGIFADFFPGAQADGAFANQMMQATFSSALSFFLSAYLSGNMTGIITLALAAAVYPGYVLAQRFVEQRRQLQKDSGIQDIEERGPGGAAAQAPPAAGAGSGLRHLPKAAS